MKIENEGTEAKTGKTVLFRFGHDYYSPKLEVLDGHVVRMEVGGQVMVKTIEQWVKQAEELKPEPGKESRLDTVIKNYNETYFGCAIGGNERQYAMDQLKMDFRSLFIKTIDETPKSGRVYSLEYYREVLKQAVEKL